MNIFFLNSFPAWGGGEKWVIEAGVGLKERGHNITISSLPGSASELKAKDVGLDTFPLMLKLDIAFWKIPGLMRFFKKTKTEVVICVQNRDVKVGALAAKLAGVPVVLVKNGLDVIKKKPFHKITFTKFIDGIITNAKVLKDTYMDYGWFEDSFIQVVYDGLEIPENIQKIDLREELSFPEDSKLILSAGRLVEQKGFDYLIEVAEIAKKESKKWRFVVVGEGKLEKELKDNAMKKGVTKIIKFIGFRKDVLPYMNAADLIVLTSRSEGLSNVLTEAMSLGKTCVATAVNGVPELFEKNSAGLMVDKNNPQAIYEGIEKVLTDPNLKSKFESNALKRIKKDFLKETMIDRLENIFMDYLSSVNTTSNL